MHLNPPETSSLVLVVDDEPKNLQVIGQLLRGEGYEIAFASNGLEALASVKENLPVLILLDIMMPEMDGYEVCQRLKADTITAHIPIMFLTAKTETEDIVRGFRTGAVDYVTKPFRSEELLARVRTHIQLKQLRSLLPICMYCNKINNEQKEWEAVDMYIRRQTRTRFTHGICPECFEKTMAEFNAEQGNVN